MTALVHGLLAAIDRIGLGLAERALDSAALELLTSPSSDRISVYDGAAGVAVFCAEWYRATGSRQARTLYTDILHALAESTPRGEPGFFTGALGVAYVLQHAAAPPFRDAASRWIEYACHSPSGSLADALGGESDVLLGLCLISPTVVPPDLRTPLTERSLVALRFLQRAAQPGPQGLWWCSHWPRQHPLTGFAHGSSGVASALLLASRVAGGHPVLSRLAQEGYAYDLHRFQDGIGWLDYRLSIADPAATARGLWRGELEALQCSQAMVAWCHGAAGIAMALTRAVQHGLTFLTPALERALHYVRIARARQRERRTLHFGLCHGLLGNLDAQLVAERAGLATADNSADDDVQFVLQALLADTEGGLSSACEQHGLFCGMTGVGYGLLRYLDDATPCVLAPTISASRPWMKSAADGLCANERPLDAIRAATGVGVQSDAARFLVIASLKRACRAALERGEMTRSDVVVGPYLFVENGVAVRFDGRTHQTRPASALRAWLASAHGAAERERPLSEEERLLLVDGWLAPRTEMERLPEWLWPRAGKEDS